MSWGNVAQMSLAYAEGVKALWAAEYRAEVDVLVLVLVLLTETCVLRDFEITPQFPESTRKMSRMRFVLLVYARWRTGLCRRDTLRATVLRSPSSI